MKIAKVSPIFKKGDKRNSILSNYRPISVLQCFSKILERIMYNSLNAYLADNNILFNKQFGLRAGHPTQHGLLELLDQISDPSIYRKLLILWIIKFYQKSFNIMEQKGTTYLDLKVITGREEYVNFEINDNNGKIELLEIICAVPQASILETLLFIIYINDLCQVSDILKPIMFADDTNLFCSSNAIKTLFLNTNLELKKISEYFYQVSGIYLLRM